MQHLSLKNTYLCFLLVLLTAVTGCDNKESLSDVTALLAGNDSKTWKAEMETKTFGDDSRRVPDEREELITFYANGKFEMTSTIEPAVGTWSYEPDGKYLNMVFEKENVKQNFRVHELEKNNAKLVASDGTVMELEAK